MSLRVNSAGSSSPSLLADEGVDIDGFLAVADDIGGRGCFAFNAPLASNVFTSGKAKAGRLSGNIGLLASGAVYISCAEDVRLMGLRAVVEGAAVI